MSRPVRASLDHLQAQKATLKTPSTEKGKLPVFLSDQSQLSPSGCARGPLQPWPSLSKALETSRLCLPRLGRPSLGPGAMSLKALAKLQKHFPFRGQNAQQTYLAPKAFASHDPCLFPFRGLFAARNFAYPSSGRELDRGELHT